MKDWMPPQPLSRSGTKARRSSAESTGGCSEHHRGGTCSRSKWLPRHRVSSTQKWQRLSLCISNRLCILRSICDVLHRRGGTSCHPGLAEQNPMNVSLSQIFDVLAEQAGVTLA